MTTQQSYRSGDQMLPYIEITDDSYADLAAKEFTAKQPAPGIILVCGPCPRCRATVEIPVVDALYRSARSIRFWRRSAGASGSSGAERQCREEPMMCTCEDQHPNRPEGQVGCGAYWTLTISVPIP